MYPCKEGYSTGMPDMLPVVSLQSTMHKRDKTLTGVSLQNSIDTTLSPKVSPPDSAHHPGCSPAVRKDHLQEGDTQDVIHEAQRGSLLSWRRGLRGTSQVLDA